MILHSLYLSFFVGVIFPAISMIFFPEVMVKKGLASGLGTSSLIYISLLFVIFTGLFLYYKSSELEFVKKAKENFVINIKVAVFIIVFLYMGRVLYLFFVGDSPYTLMALNGTMDIGNGVFGKVINYYYIETSFRLYPLFQGLIILSLPRKYLPYFFLFEILYGGFVYSKFIVFLNLIAIALVYMDYKNIWSRKKAILYLVIMSIVSVILLIVLREVFGQLRMGQSIDFNSIDFNSVIVHAISRIQSFLSVFYAEVVLSDALLEGKTMCRIIGYAVPDSFVPLPLNCQNIDEPVLIYYYGLSESRIIDKDLLTLWGEPYANFGILGVGLFIFLILIFKVCVEKLGPNKYGFVFTWVIFFNLMLGQQAWIMTLKQLFISFFVLWLIQKIGLMYESKKEDS